MYVKKADIKQDPLARTRAIAGLRAGRSVDAL
jgi:hypothetical protein